MEEFNKKINFEYVRKKMKDKIIYLNSLFGIIILLCGFIISHNMDNNHSNKNEKNPIEKSSIQCNATICIGIQLDNFQRRCITNKDKFKILTFFETQFLENKKVDRKIILLELSRKISLNIPISFIQYHLSPPKVDSLPVLS